MPFTVSHIAAVLPFRKAHLVWSALVIGSVAPDFPYLVGNIEHRALGHQWPGVIEFTLPASIVALWLLHNVVKRPAIKLLPVSLQLRLRGRLGNFKFGGPAHFAVILFSLALGIATHLAWDTLTHPWLWPGRQWRWLGHVVKLPITGPMPLFMLLQYASSLIGLVALAVWLWLWYRNTPPQENTAPVAASRPEIALAMLALAIIAGTVRAGLTVRIPRNLEMADKFMLIVGVTFMAVVFWELFAYCVLISSHQSWTLS